MQAAINTTLVTLVYSPALDFNGGTTLTAGSGGTPVRLIYVATP